MNASAPSIPHGHDDRDAHGHDDHGGGHGHIVLQYQPGLPLSKGKLIMWLFLSTEIMFFAALLGSYVVLRFGAAIWPKPHHVHLSEPIGAFNTFVLICSSVTIVLALEAAKANKVSMAKNWMIATLLLGSLFLGIKGYEYSAKFSHGIYPSQPHSRIYEKPDLYYGSAVRARLDELRKVPLGLVPAGLREAADSSAEAGSTVDLLKRLDEAPADKLSAEQQTARGRLQKVQK
ncbi:MAG: Cytochrome c oxidase subunit 3, partial [Planctomycetota bacterium]